VGERLGTFTPLADHVSRQLMQCLYTAWQNQQFFYLSGFDCLLPVAEILKQEEQKWACFETHNQVDHFETWTF